MSSKEWQELQRITGLDILTIVSNLAAGHVSAGDTMTLISNQIELAFQLGYNMAKREIEE